MSDRKVELAQYVCEVGGDLIVLARRHGLDSTAHCLELAVACAADEIAAVRGKKEPQTGPSLSVVSG